jgi:hypothetical protein
VKIISCTPDELPKVLKEAEVMMQVRQQATVWGAFAAAAEFHVITAEAHRWNSL